MWAAFRQGSCGFVSWRVSLRSSSGRVAVASFAELAREQAFARAQAHLIGRSVFVRPGPAIGGRVTSWRVSVPVQAWLSLPSFGQLIVAGGSGLRGVVSQLRCLGFVSVK